VEATGGNPALTKVLPFVLYDTLGPTLPEGLQGAAALWGLAQRCAMTYPEAVQRAGHADGNALFDAILEGRSGITFTLDEYEGDFGYITHPDKRIALEIPEMLAELDGLREAAPGLTSDEFSIVLSLGERRSYTANTIFRDPDWRKRDLDGALRVSLEDAERLGLADGGRALITTKRGSAEASVEVSEAMQAGHASLPNGYGLDFTDTSGRTRIPGVSPNALSSSDWRDEFAGTPWHKHVPARIGPIAA
jgi:formate dehydrogenase